jgi:hypothetical protein
VLDLMLPALGPTKISCVLVGNTDDCTLNLFDAAETSCGTYRRCRRRLSVSVAPFSTSKRNKSKLIAMDLDQHIIGCLFAVGSDDDPRKWLGVVDRHDFLCAAGRGGAYRKWKKVHFDYLICKRK